MTYYYTKLLKEEVGERIAKHRKKHNLRQIDISDEAGINSSYYAKIEQGIVNPSLEKIYRIIKALKCHSSDILPF